MGDEVNRLREFLARALNLGRTRGSSWRPDRSLGGRCAKHPRHRGSRDSPPGARLDELAAMVRSAGDCRGRGSQSEHDDRSAQYPHLRATRRVEPLRRALRHRRYRIRRIDGEHDLPCGGNLLLVGRARVSVAAFFRPRGVAHRRTLLFRRALCIARANHLVRRDRVSGRSCVVPCARVLSRRCYSSALFSLSRFRLC